MAIVLSITLTADTQSETEDAFKAEGEPITFEEFITNQFYPTYFNGTWWSANEIQWSDPDMQHARTSRGAVEKPLSAAESTERLLRLEVS